MYCTCIYIHLENVDTVTEYKYSGIMNAVVHKVFIAKHDSCVSLKNRKLPIDQWPSSLNLCRSSANSHRQSHHPCLLTGTQISTIEILIVINVTEACREVQSPLDREY